MGNTLYQKYHNFSRLVKDIAIYWSFPKIILTIYYIRKNLRFKEGFPTSGNDIFIVLVCRRTISSLPVSRPDCERTCSGRHADRSFWLVQNLSCPLIYFPKPFIIIQLSQIGIKLWGNSNFFITPYSLLFSFMLSL